MDLFGDTTAILNSIVPDNYYGMRCEQIHTNLPPPTPLSNFLLFQPYFIFFFFSRSSQREAVFPHIFFFTTTKKINQTAIHGYIIVMVA